MEILKLKTQQAKYNHNYFVFILFYFVSYLYIYIVLFMLNSNNSQISYLVINSKYRNHPNYESTTNFTYSLSKSIKITKFIQLAYAAIPESSYLINSYNNKFSITFNDNTTKLITIPSNNYDSDSLGLTISNLINYDGFKIIFDASQFKYVMSADTKEFIINDVENNIYDIIGLNPKIINQSNNLTYKCPNYINMISPTLFYIHLNQFSNNRIYSKNINSSFVIPCTCNKNDVNYYNNNTSYTNIFFIDQLIDLHTIAITITDDKNRLYNNNNVPIELIFIFQ